MGAGALVNRVPDLEVSAVVDSLHAMACVADCELEVA